MGIGIIGAGKVGAVLGAALRAAGHVITGVHAVSEESLTRAEALLPEVPILEIPEIMRRSEVVLFAVPDDVLEPLVTGLTDGGHLGPGQILIHTSGRSGTQVFAAALRAGAIGLAIHPAMTFTGLSLDVARLRQATFGVTAASPFLPIAQALVLEMGGEPLVVAEGDRPLYHAALAHASNHLITLVGQSIQMLSSLGAADPAQVLGPLLKASLENVLASGDSALTGPVARGDVGTVAAHREVLESFAQEEGAADIGETYRAAASATARRAHAHGRLDAESLQQVLRALDPRQQEDGSRDEGPAQGT